MKYTIDDLYVGMQFMFCGAKYTITKITNNYIYDINPFGTEERYDIKPYLSLINDYSFKLIKQSYEVYN